MVPQPDEPAKAPIWGLFFVSALAGAISSFSMAPYNIWPLLFLGLGALFVVQTTFVKKHHAFISGWVFGFFYFVSGLSWIGNALLVEGNEYVWAWPLAVSGLPAILAFFPALACYAAKHLFAGNRLPFYFGLAALLSLSELARGHIFTGFPWNLYGYTWANNLPVIQILHIGNVYWLTAITIFWGLAAGYIYLHRHTPKIIATILLAVVFTISCTHIYGTMRLSQKETDTNPDITVHLVQPNVDQADKWKRAEMPEHFERLLELSKPKGDQSQTTLTTLIIWPETATNYLFLDNEFMLSRIRDILSLYKNEVFLITGALLRDENGHPSNSLLVLDRNADIKHRYNKSHLVPFGEYIPFQKWIPLKTVSGFSGFERGHGPEVIHINNNFSFSPLICYEILFPSNTIPADQKADAIINLTNDGWYGQSAGPYQHYLKARYRAIEQNSPVIRSANTGISGVFDGYGREMAHIKLMETGSIQIGLPEKTKRAFSLGKHSDTILLFTMLLIVLICSQKKFRITIKK